MAGDFRLGPGPSAGGAQLRAGSREVHRLCLRFGPRAPDHAALRYRGPAPVLRRRSSFPRAVRINVPKSWLRSFCDPKLAGQQLADKLTMAGIEVEAYASVGAKLD